MPEGSLLQAQGRLLHLVGILQAVAIHLATAMAESEEKVCPTCGVSCAPDADRCPYGHPFEAAEPPLMAPAASAPDEAAATVPPVTDAPPAQIYPPGFSAQPSTGPTMGERIIPTKNPKALIAYYCGVFALVPCFTPLLAPAALILGILGKNECKRNPGLPGWGHAIAGIVLGGILTVLTLVVIGWVIWAVMNQPPHP